MQQRAGNEVFGGATVGAGYEGPTVEDGVYPLKVTNIEVGTNSADGGKFLIWKFDVEVEDDVLEMSGSSSLSFTPKSKATRWATALFGRTLEKGENLTVEMFRGKRGLGLVNTKEVGDFPKVMEVMRAAAPKPERKTAMTIDEAVNGPTPEPKPEPEAVAAGLFGDDPAF